MIMPDHHFYENYIFHIKKHHFIGNCSLDDKAEIFTEDFKALGHGTKSNNRRSNAQACRALPTNEECDQWALLNSQ